MHEPDPTPERPQLTDMQRDRIDFAQRDLENFRDADLTQIDDAGLVLIIARLLTRLDDTLRVAAEITGE